MEMPTESGASWKVTSSDVIDWLLCGNRHYMFDLGHLPSETDLRKYFRSPRRVIRKVLGDLAHLGILERRRSLGTFSDKPFEEKFIGRDREGERRAALRYIVLSTEIVEGNAVSESIFEANGGRMLRVERLTCLKGNPLGLWVMYIRAEAKEEIPEELLVENVQSLASFLAKGPVSVKYDFTAVVADEHAAEILDIPVGCPLLHVERSYYKGEQLMLVGFGRRVGVRLSVGTEIVQP